MAKVRYRSSLKKRENGEYIKNIEKRTKSGCLTCRRRRKKCDELKPRCAGCNRNLLACKWPSTFENTRSQDLDRKGSSAGHKYSFVHVPHKELFQTKGEVGRAGANRSQKAFNLSQVHDDTLCRISRDICPTLKTLVQNENTKLVSILRNEQLKSGKKDQVSLNSDTKWIQTEDGKTSFSYEHEFETEDKIERSHPLLDHHPIEFEHQSCAPNGSSEKEKQNYFSETHNLPSTNDKNLYKGFFDLQLEPYVFLERSSLEGLPWVPEHDHSKQLDRVSEKCESLMQPSSNGHENSDVMFQPNYSFLNDDYNYAVEKYHKIIEDYDKGEPVGNTGIENDEDLLFYTCIKKFVPNLGTQDTHPLLTACATFTPKVENNMPLKEIFLCCGATYLEWYDDVKFSALSDSLNKSSQMLIDKYLQKESPPDDGSWLLVAFLLLCLRSKMASSGTVDECVNFLSKAYLVIQNKIILRNKDKSHMANGLQNLAYEIENKFMRQSANDKMKGDLVLQPYERMSVESFIYNYSVAILFATDISKLPNPFFVFKELDHVLKCPLYHCYFEWMNNPVLGPSLDAFEVLAKVSYIGRFPMPLEKSSLWYQRAQQLQNMAFFYTGPILPPQLKSKNAEVYEKAKLSSLVGGIVAKSSYLLVSKILKYDHFEIRQPSIQKIRREIFEAFSAIPLESKIWGILIWSLIITGCFSTGMPQKGLILKYLLSVGEYFHHQSTIEIRSLLEKTWSLPENERLDILFDRKELAKVAP